MRTKIRTLTIDAKNPLEFEGKEITLKGWLRTVRNKKTLAFLEINDGSTLGNFQGILDSDYPDFENIVNSLSTGSAVTVKGEIVKSPGGEQSIEMKVTDLELVGTCDPTDYPLQKKRHSFEFLRSIAHLRPRTNTIGAVMRIRNALTYASHKYFQERGFLNVHTPIITASDCEGAGEMFRVTTMNGEAPKDDKGQTDYTEDFFAKPAFLTVSGQLNAEIYACALSDVYTFGPTFRAENSNTSRHLAEFWMLEPEMAFADLNDDMDCAEGYLRYVIKYLLDNCQEDLNLFNRFIDKELIARLENVVANDFARLTYTEAVEILEKSGKKFEYPVSWGNDLQSEHERYLSEEHCKKPVIIYNYPKDIKAFYMRSNDDGKTVAAMDILVPKIGELVGGSQREERLDVLEAKLDEMGLPKEDYWWYLELRKYGSVPHAGFGVGFERLILFATGMENIRDVIPFPRYPGKADF